MKKTVTPTKSVAKKPEQQSLPSTVLNFAAHAGKGLEGTGKADFAIPFLTMLQSNSPQLETVPGAKKGLFINSITNELFTEVLVIPCAYQRRFVRWAPRATGGGYRGEVSPLDVEAGTVKGMSSHDGQFLMDVPEGTKNAFDKDGKPLFDHLADTRNFFILVQSESGRWTPALMALSSTQIKKAKKWLSLIQGIEMKEDGKPYTPPSFSHMYSLATEKESNAKGEWYGLKATLEEVLTDQSLLDRAVAFHDSVTAGTVKVSQPAPE